MRKLLLSLAAAAGLGGLAAPAAHAAHDALYYKLNTAQYDYTYEWEEQRARHFASFYWDGKAYCRYRTGWNGPGAYEAGTRLRRGHGWDGGYPWQGPGTPADHDDDQSFAEYQASYAREFAHGPFCGTRHYRRHRHGVVLRRMD